MLRCTVVLILALVTIPARAPAFDGITHAAVTADATRKIQGGLCRDEEMRNVLLFTSMAPDLSFADGERTYQALHDPDFALALWNVGLTRQGKDCDRLRIAAYGWASHICADRVAHADGGYSNAKSVFDKAPPDQPLANHLAVESSVGLLAYRDHQAVIDSVSYWMPSTGDFLAAVDEFRRIKRGKAAKALAEARSAGVEGDDARVRAARSEAEKENARAAAEFPAEEYDRSCLKFRASFDLERALFRRTIEARPVLVAEMDARFADRAKGVLGKGGLEQATEDVRCQCVFIDEHEPRLDDDGGGSGVTEAGCAVTRSLVLSGESKASDLALGAAASRENLERGLDGQLRAASSGSPDLMLYYLCGVLQDTGSNLTQIVDDAQAEQALAADRLLDADQARRQVERLRGRIATLEQRIENHTLVDRALAAIFGDTDRESLDSARQELARLLRTQASAPPSVASGAHDAPASPAAARSPATSAAETFDDLNRTALR